MVPGLSSHVNARSFRLRRKHSIIPCFNQGLALQFTGVGRTQALVFTPSDRKLGAMPSDKRLEPLHERSQCSFSPLHPLAIETPPIRQPSLSKKKCGEVKCDQ